MIILGVDPNSKHIGYCVLDVSLDVPSVAKAWTDTIDVGNVYQLTRKSIVGAISTLLVEMAKKRDNESLVIIEDYFYRGSQAKVVLELLGIIKLECIDNGLLYDLISPASVKSTLMGKGNYHIRHADGKRKTEKQKKDEIKVSLLKLGFNVDYLDDHAIDAIAIAYSYWCRSLR